MNPLKSLSQNLSGVFQPAKVFTKFETGLDDLVKKLNSNPTNEERLRNALSYRLLDKKNEGKNTLAGAAAGGMASLLPSSFSLADSNKSWGEALSDTAGNAFTGAGLGGVLGRFGPRLASKGVGRVLTNLSEPRSYETDSKFNLLKQLKAKDIFKAVWSDKPVYKATKLDGIGSHGAYSAREVPYRMMFGLQPRAFRNFFRQEVKDPRTLHYNTENPAASKELGQIGRETDFARKLNGVKEVDQSPILLGSQTVPGNVHVNADGSFKDVWDLGLHPGEKLDSKGKILRALVHMFSDPVTIKGKAPVKYHEELRKARESAEQTARPSLTSSLPSVAQAKSPLILAYR